MSRPRPAAGLCSPLAALPGQEETRPEPTFNSQDAPDDIHRLARQLVCFLHDLDDKTDGTADEKPPYHATRRHTLISCIHGSALCAPSTIISLEPDTLQQTGGGGYTHGSEGHPDQTPASPLRASVARAPSTGAVQPGGRPWKGAPRRSEARAEAARGAGEG